MNPFDKSDNLMCSSSGAAAPPEVTEDLLMAYNKGCTRASQFIDERLAKGKVGFFDKISKARLKTFDSMVHSVSVRTGGRQVAVRADRSFFA